MPKVNDAPYSRRAKSALILSTDSLGAALLAAALELVGFRAAFARAEETAADAFRRLKPRAVLLDAKDLELRDSHVLGPAMMTGARVLFFGTAESVRQVQALAAKANAVLLVLPEDLPRLPFLLATLPDAGRRSER